MRQEIAVDDGPQVYERIALSPCVNNELDSIINAVQKDVTRATLIDSPDRVWTPHHTWDSAVFQGAAAAGILVRMPIERIDAVSRFYNLMPVLEAADEREFRDGAALYLSRTGGALTKLEKDRILGTVKALRRDNAEIVRLATVAAGSINHLGIRVADYHPADSRTSPLQDADRVVVELQNHPMAQRCVGELEKAVPHR